MVRARVKLWDMDPDAMRLLGLAREGEAVQSRQLGMNRPDGRHTFAVSTKPGSDDILIAFRSTDGSRLVVYLTNSERKLRAAMVSEPGRTALLTNEQAAAGYCAALRLFSATLKEHYNK